MPHGINFLVNDVFVENSASKKKVRYNNMANEYGIFQSIVESDQALNEGIKDWAKGKIDSYKKEQQRKGIWNTYRYKERLWTTFC